MAVQGSGRVLLCSVLNSSFALPLTHVLETMRPLPVQPIPGSPSFVRGLAIVRGEPIPVVDLACLMEGGKGSPRRWVMVRAGEAATVLEVDRILGVHSLPDQLLRDLPPLLQNADAEIVSAMGVLDAGLLLVLDQGRLLPDGLPQPADSMLAGARS
jgi:purine-binding chemotaxis protein CheW